MELFYSNDIDGGICRLDQDESGHCVKVLRHRSGDEISVIDGCGTLYRCRITSDSHKGVEAAVLESVPDWGGHPYRLHMAVCPTKNNDRYEWFVEKACEIGMDEVSPVIGEHSERRVFKTARMEKILVSAAKQSLKGAVPVVNEPVSVREFIEGMAGSGTGKNVAVGAGCVGDGKSRADGVGTGRAGAGGVGAGRAGASGVGAGGVGTCESGAVSIGAGGSGVCEPLKLIAYCFEDERVPRRSIKEVLGGYEGSDVVVLIGPEGDFSKAEAELAIQNGFIPVHLGDSRLRTETAALTAVAAVYFRYMV